MSPLLHHKYRHSLSNCQMNFSTWQFLNEKKKPLKISIAHFDCSSVTVNDWCKTNSMYTFAKKSKKQKVKMKNTMKKVY